MEPLGKKLQDARLARRITLEEASRVTKIRASRIQELEEEDFSSFSSLAYAKGFLLIYGKYLEVDVAPYLEAFETSDRMTVDGYSYLQDNGPTAPPPIVRRQPRKRPALLPFLFAIAVLIIGIYLVKFMLDLQRIAPPREGTAASPPASATLSPTTPSPAEVVAPRALPVEGTPASEAGVATATPAPTIATPKEPEVRRAEPVHPEDVPATAPPPPNVSPGRGRGGG
jgi:cytoskeleton protein RodZ